MIENIDIYLFHLINSGLSCKIFDKIMPIMTNVENWFLVYIFLFVWLLWKGGKNGRILAALLVLTIIISDQLCSSLLKDLFNRIRPCRALGDVNLLVHCGSGKSFPSSHAVNNFAAAMLLGKHFKQYRTAYLIIALIISFSRIYVGVHYPFDVLAGAIIGVIIGILMAFVYEKLIELRKKNENQTPIDSQP